MSSASPRASVVVLNFSGGDLVVASVASVLAQDVPVEVVVVDNGSTDGSLEALRRTFPGLRIVENGRNLGFAAGMDVGYAATTGELFVPLNCDAVLEPTFVRRALAVLDAAPDVGAVAPLVVRIGEAPVGAWTAAGSAAEPAVLDGGPIDLQVHLSVHPGDDLGRARECFKPNGAAPAFRRAALDEVVAAYGVGPYDPGFDTYGEDVDLAFKLWARGWRTWYAPTLRAGHVRSFASRVGVADKRGRLRVLLLASRHVNTWRHLRSWRLALAAPAVLAGDVALAAYGLVRGDPSAPADVLAAWRRVLGQRGELRRFRRTHPPADAPPGVFAWVSPRRRVRHVPPELLRG